jgi:hypothetical protein
VGKLLVSPIQEAIDKRIHKMSEIENAKRKNAMDPTLTNAQIKMKKAVMTQITSDQQPEIKFFEGKLVAK